MEDFLHIYKKSYSIVYSVRIVNMMIVKEYGVYIEFKDWGRLHMYYKQWLLNRSFYTSWKSDKLQSSKQMYV